MTTNVVGKPAGQAQRYFPDIPRLLGKTSDNRRIRLDPAESKTQTQVNAEYAAQMPDYRDYLQTPEQRDKMIVELRKLGLSYSFIGRHVGMSANGVMHSLRRIAAGRPGRPAASAPRTRPK